MEQVDFGYNGELGLTIYRACFHKYAYARSTRKPFQVEMSKLVAKTEEIFFFLVVQGIKNGNNVGSILEIPDSMGGTCFQIAATCSTKIIMFILKSDMKVNSITSDMMVPGFNYSDFTIQMMKKGINPFVIDYKGQSSISMIPSHFER